MPRSLTVSEMKTITNKNAHSIIYYIITWHSIKYQEFHVAGVSALAMKGMKSQSYRRCT